VNRTTGWKICATRILLTALLALTPLGCQSARVGANNIPVKRAWRKIEPDTTDRAQVHKLLGPPHSPGKVSDVWEFRKKNGKTIVIEISYKSNTVAAKRGYNLP